MKYVIFMKYYAENYCHTEWRKQKVKISWNESWKSSILYKKINIWKLLMIKNSWYHEIYHRNLSSWNKQKCIRSKIYYNDIYTENDSHIEGKGDIREWIPVMKIVSRLTLHKKEMDEYFLS